MDLLLFPGVIPGLTLLFLLIVGIAALFGYQAERRRAEEAGQEPNTRRVVRNTIMGILVVPVVAVVAVTYILAQDGEFGVGGIALAGLVGVVIAILGAFEKKD